MIFLSKKQRQSFTSISDLIKDKMGTLKNAPFQQTISLHQHWKLITGPLISAHSKVLYVKENCLYIGVDNSTWHNELTMMKESLLSQINEQLSDHYITEIKFKVMS